LTSGRDAIIRSKRFSDSYGAQAAAAVHTSLLCFTEPRRECTWAELGVAIASGMMFGFLKLNQNDGPKQFHEG
jgi:hypothetical protein